MLVDVYNKDGQISGQVELKDEIFGIEPNEHSMHLAVVAYLANQRQGTHKTKTRKDVSGGGKKPWRQKGRGTARAGSIRSPLWVGGGTVHGPVPHDYDMKINKKIKKLARKSALSARLQENNILVVEDFDFDTVESRLTNNMVQILKNLNLYGEKTLIMLPDFNYKLYLASRNIEKVSIYPADKVSTYDILNHKKLLIFKGAVSVIEKTLLN